MLKHKTMKPLIFKSIALCAVLGFSVLCGKAQEVKKIEFDTNIIVGKWIAIDGNKQFELHIVKDTLFFPIDKTYFESLNGAIIYKKNGDIIRTTTINGYESFVSAVMTSPSQISIRIHDMERKIAVRGFMIIDLNKPHKANWELRKSEMRMSHPDWNLVDFDIPTELEWTKIE